MQNFLYILAWKFMKIVPDKIAFRLFDFLASKFSKKEKITFQLKKNLSRVLGKPFEEITENELEKSLKKYFRYWAEVFRMPYWKNEKIKNKFTNSVIGTNYLDEALKEKKGVILVLPHSGNWDAAGVWLVNNYGNFATVAERLKPEYLFKKFVSFRESLGFKIFALTGSNISPFQLLEKELKAGKIICLLGERDLTKKGIKVNFFGEIATMPVGPAKLAKKTGAAILPVHCWNDKGENRFGIYEKINSDGSEEEIIQRLASVFEDNIKKYPYDWHMLQALWVNDLDKTRMKDS